MPSVCIVTTVHSPLDPRIFAKQAKTLAEAGYAVSLLAPHERDEEHEGVEIKGLPRPRSRLARVTGLSWQVFRQAWRRRSDIYHFHDPELIPTMLLLGALRRRPIIYDVHEDYVTSVMGKSYLPSVLRRPLAGAVALLERMASRRFTVILAERYYAERFPQGTPVLNYPRPEAVLAPAVPSPVLPLVPRVLYTGNVTEDRGALIHARLPHLMEGLHVYMVGRCPPGLATRLRSVTSPQEDKLHLEGVGEYIPHDRIQAYYAAGGWSAGLALFPPSTHYQRKELTKLFEYMAAGVPVVASAFPVWREIVEGNDCGVTVDPLDPAEIRRALEYIVNRPDEARRMGENGRRAVEHKYRWDTEGARLLAVYRGLVERGRSQRAAS